VSELEAGVQWPGLHLGLSASGLSLYPSVYVDLLMLTPAKGGITISHPLLMVTTAELVARAVLTNLPSVRCFGCLSAHVGVLEKDAREAAQLLIVRGEFSIARRMCPICGRTDDVLVSGKAPPRGEP
jgi:hypothetical protein